MTLEKVIRERSARMLSCYTVEKTLLEILNYHLLSSWPVSVPMYSPTLVTMTTKVVTYTNILCIVLYVNKR